jgi:hypothetical protein
MLNPSIPGQVKIGRTQGSPRTRARELSTTGVPKQFIVLWHEFVDDSEAVEKHLHQQFKSARTNKRREFFEIEPQVAIRALIDAAQGHAFAIPRDTVAISIIAELRKQYTTNLRDDITDVRLFQTEHGIFLEVHRRPYKNLRREITDYVDLDVLGNYFNRRARVEENAVRFLKLDELSIVNVTDLLADDVAQAIWDKHMGK